MENPNGKIGLGWRLANRLYPLALGIGFLISVGLPATYYVLESNALRGTATLYAQNLSGKFQDLVIDVPNVWTYPDNIQRYRQMLHDFLPHSNDVTTILILDEAGRSIAGYEHETKKAEAWWNRYGPSGSAPIIFNNRVIGTVQVGVAWGSLLGVTLSLLVLSTAMGVGLAILVYVFPVKVVRGMEGQIEDLIERLQRSNEEISRRHDQMEILSLSARYLTTIRDVDQLLPRIAGAASELMEADGAGLRLVEGDELVVGARVGVAEAVMTSSRIQIGESLSGRVFAEGRPVAVSDLDADPTDLSPIKARALASGVQSVLAVPLRSDGRTIGALSVYSKARREFSQEEISLLSAFTDQAALAFQSAQLFAETRQQKTELEQIFNSTSDGIVTLDPTGCVVSANHRAEELLGLAGSAAGCPLEVLGLNATDAGRIEEEFRALLAEPGREGEGDLEITEPVRRLLHWVARPTLDPDKRPVGVTITFRDVTREREVDRMKTEFISTVSHELRTPLTSIKGALQLVMEEPEFHQNPMAEELLTISFTNTERLIRLINDILDISKIEAGRIQLKLDSHQVEEIVVAAVEGVRSFAAQCQITLRSDVAAGLPPVVVDLDRMIQVVTNLLSNAIKFSPEGSTVQVEARAVAGEVEVGVRDQGRGISPEDVQKLFKKFNQLDGSAVREVGGTGLGLAICKGVVEEHRGRIWVESELGKGASFLFRLPVAGAAGLKSRKILVADDDPELRQAVGELLRREVASLDLEFAVDGTEAMLRIGQFAPDLLILDNRMPGLDGIAVCRKIRENPELRAIKILGVTGFTEDLPLLREAGADESLAKPLDLAELRAAIARLLGPRPVREPSTPAVIERGERLPKGVHRILVVDDEPDIRYILRQHLERQGYQVVEAASGLEALEKARALQPDLITLDVMMPDMDGFDVMKVLRGSEETRQIPVIFLSVVQDEAKGLRLGASDYLTKPIDPERLLATVSRVLPPEEARESTGVLVIDDDPDIVQVLSHTLGRAGYRVSTASNGHDGLTRLFNEIPDLVILDLKMPGMSGYEVIRQVRSTRRVAQIPILVLTASDVGDGRERALALGANEYLRKPISNDQLLAEISRLVHAVGTPASAGVAKG